MLIKYDDCPPPELSLHHDADSGAECVRLLHGMSSEDGTTALLEAATDRVPYESLRLRIHSRARFVW